MRENKVGKKKYWTKRKNDCKVLLSIWQRLSASAARGSCRELILRGVMGKNTKQISAER